MKAHKGDEEWATAENIVSQMKPMEEYLHHEGWELYNETEYGTIPIAILLEKLEEDEKGGAAPNMMGRGKNLPDDWMHDAEKINSYVFLEQATQGMYSFAYSHKTWHQQIDLDQSGKVQ